MAWAAETNIKGPAGPPGPPGPGGIGEAPVTNTLYARQNAAWTSIPRITVSATAPASPAVNDVWIDTT